MAARIPITAMTTRSSIIVNPERSRRMVKPVGAVDFRLWIMDFRSFAQLPGAVSDLIFNIIGLPLP